MSSETEITSEWMEQVGTKELNPVCYVLKSALHNIEIRFGPRLDTCWIYNGYSESLFATPVYNVPKTREQLRTLCEFFDIEFNKTKGT